MPAVQSQCVVEPQLQQWWQSLAGRMAVEGTVVEGRAAQGRPVQGTAVRGMAAQGCHMRAVVCHASPSLLLKKNVFHIIMKYEI